MDGRGRGVFLPYGLAICVAGAAAALAVSSWAAVAVLAAGLAAALLVGELRVAREPAGKARRLFVERRRAEEALRASEERLRLALDAGGMGAYDWNVGTGELVWSEQLERLHGLAPGTFGRTFDAALSRVHPDDRELFRLAAADALEAGTKNQIEYRTVWPDGSVHWLVGKGDVLRDAVGRALRLTGVVMDVDGRKRLEAAQAANRAKDEFLATLSDELRTPLSAILGWTQLLRGGKLDEAGVARALGTIEHNAKLQVQLIEGLLDVSRLITGKLCLESTPVDLVTVETQLDAPGPLAADGARLQQVVWNLLSNAIKFTPPNGRVTIRLERTGAEAELRVSDTGRGIAPEFLPHIFDCFRQADSSSTRAHGGLGLGLAIVRHLVELHGGNVQAESAGANLGATFTVRLPLPALAAGEGSSGSRPEDLPSLRGVSILVVDDALDARESLAMLLEECGAHVTAVASAPEALEALASARPDVLVSDLAMPGLDGYALVARLRSLEADGATPVPALALSAYARTEDRERALAAGFQAHVAKPVEPIEIASAVARLAGAS